MYELPLQATRACAHMIVLYWEAGSITTYLATAWHFQDLCRHTGSFNEGQTCFAQLVVDDNRELN